MRFHKIHTFLPSVFLLTTLPLMPTVASTQVAFESNAQINGGEYRALTTQASAGDVRVGTTSPANALGVNSSLAVDTYAGTVSGATNEPVVGGNVGTGTMSPAKRMKVDINGPVQAAGTRSAPCAASDVGAMRYNASANYMEICTYP
jgi:hypothetical protein